MIGALRVKVPSYAKENSWDIFPTFISKISSCNLKELISQRKIFLEQISYLKIVSLIYYIVSEINILTKFRWAICYTFKINCTSFEKMNGFLINMQ